MDSLLTDHTPEVERRLAAICVKTRDSCSFFKARENSLVKLRECWYCKYGEFGINTEHPTKNGVCKYKE